MKTLSVTAVTAWRMTQKEDMLLTKEAYVDLGHYRGALNGVQSLANFLFDLSRELLAYSDQLLNMEAVPDLSCPPIVVQ